MKAKSAVVGVGFIGAQHIQGHRAAGNTELVAVVDRDEIRGREAAAKYGIKHFSTLGELFSQEPEVALIDVCVPTPLHEELVVQAAEAGKNVLCEKPVTFTLESFQRMRAAAEEAHVQFMVAQVIRFWPEYVRALELRDEGAFGKLHMIHARRLCETPNWSPWYCDPLKSGGALYDLMLHDLDFVQLFVGEIDRVFATGAKNECGCWNHVQANIRFKNGASAVVESCNQAYGHFPFTMGLQVFGENGIADFALSAGHNIDEIGTRALYTYAHDQQPTRQEVMPEDAYTAEIRYFADCILTGKPAARASLDSSETTLKLVLAVKRSLETGEVVKF